MDTNSNGVARICVTTFSVISEADQIQWGGGSNRNLKFSGIPVSGPDSVGGG